MTPEAIFRTAVPLLAVLAAIWSNRRRAAGRAAVPPPVHAADDAMEAERTRRVQEDIRRKIAQRAARAAAPAPAPPPVVARGAPEPAARPQPAAAPSPIEATSLCRDPAPAAAPKRDWLSDLRDRPGARRAILLREILGPPVGLR